MCDGSNLVFGSLSNALYYLTTVTIRSNSYTEAEPNQIKIVHLKFML